MCVLAVYTTALAVLTLIPSFRSGRRGRLTKREGIRLLITGRFDSHNWCRSHLLPLARASCVDEIIAVVDGPTLDHEKIRYERPPRLLRCTLGRVLSRGIWMLKVAGDHPPDIVMGYYVFPGGITAAVVSRMVRARSLYQMTGGPNEWIGGGYQTENVLLGSLTGPSRLLEKLIFRIARSFDTVVVRGHRASEYVRSCVPGPRVEVIAGSVDPHRYTGHSTGREYDIATVGQLIPRKQVCHLLEVVARLKESRPAVRAAVVGDGPLMDDLRSRAEALGITGNVEFLGHQERVEDILHHTKVFVLTSRHEGLSIALAEAMTAGAVPVVADVGDLAELVRDGVTGYLVRLGDIDGFAECIGGLLDDDDRRRGFSHAAHRIAAENNSLSAVTAKWERCLLETMDAPNSVDRMTHRERPRSRKPLRPTRRMHVDHRI